MLRNGRFCEKICKNLLIKNNFYRRFGPRELKCQYQSRMLTSGKDGKTIIDPCSRDAGKKTESTSSSHNKSVNETPSSDTAPQPPGSCKTMSGTKPGSPSLMDQLPKPSINCKWEEHQRKSAFKRNLILISGLILFVLAAIPMFKKMNPQVDPPKKDQKTSVAKKSKRPWVIAKNPPNSGAIPSQVPYLLIGGGTASFSAFRAIKSRDPKAKVLVIGNEPYYPYMRPPLSKEMYYVQDRSVAKKLKFKQWNGTERSLFYEPDDFYSSCEKLDEEENGGVAVARGWTVKRIDATNRIAYLEDGAKIKYDKCLIATGAKPKNHPVFEDIDKEMSEKVSLYRNIFDYEELEEIIENGAKSIVIVGGSFLGSELACALARRGKRQKLKVTQIFKESGNMGKILPEYLSKWTTRKVQKEGVRVLPNTLVEDVDLKNGNLVLTLNNGKEIMADQVVLALGVIPNTDLAAASNLEVDKELGGYLVNSELEARSNLYVAGDCACFYDAKLGRRRVEHHDHAVVSGRLAGENMTGAGKPYWHQSMFWSDLGPDVGYEAIGIIDSSLPTVGVYAKVTKKDKPRAIPTSEKSDGMRSTTEETVDENDKEDEKIEVEESNDNVAKEGTEQEEEEEEVTDGESGIDSEEGGNGVIEGEKKKDISSQRKPEEEYGKGVIFYLREGIVVGIVLWNVFNRMSIARQVLSDERKYEDLNEVAKLFNIHKD